MSPDGVSESSSELSVEKKSFVTMPRVECVDSEKYCGLARSLTLLLGCAGGVPGISSSISIKDSLPVTPVVSILVSVIMVSLVCATETVDIDGSITVVGGGSTVTDGSCSSRSLAG